MIRRLGFCHSLDPFGNILNGFLDALRGDAVFTVVLFLNVAAALGLVNRGLHRFRDGIGIHDDMPIDVTGGTTHRLNQSALRPQETLPYQRPESSPD